MGRFYHADIEFGNDVLRVAAVPEAQDENALATAAPDAVLAAPHLPGLILQFAERLDAFAEEFARLVVCGRINFQPPERQFRVIELKLHRLGRVQGGLAQSGAFARLADEDLDRAAGLCRAQFHAAAHFVQFLRFKDGIAVMRVIQGNEHRREIGRAIEELLAQDPVLRLVPKGDSALVATAFGQFRRCELDRCLLAGFQRQPGTGAGGASAAIGGQAHLAHQIPLDAGEVLNHALHRQKLLAIPHLRSRCRRREIPAVRREVLRGRQHRREEFGVVPRPRQAADFLLIISDIETGAHQVEAPVLGLRVHQFQRRIGQLHLHRPEFRPAPDRRLVGADPFLVADMAALLAGTLKAAVEAVHDEMVVTVHAVARRNHDFNAVMPENRQIRILLLAPLLRRNIAFHTKDNCSIGIDNARLGPPLRRGALAVADADEGVQRRALFPAGLLQAPVNHRRRFAGEGLVGRGAQGNGRQKNDGKESLHSKPPSVLLRQLDIPSGLNMRLLVVAVYVLKCCIHAGCTAGIRLNCLPKLQALRMTVHKAGVGHSRVGNCWGAVIHFSGISGSMGETNGAASIDV